MNTERIATAIVIPRANPPGVRLLAVALSVGCWPAGRPSADPPAASAAFTSGDPLVVAARGLLDDGDLSDIERMLRNEPRVGDVPARDELAEIVRRLRHEYALDQDGLAAAARAVVPDATDDELGAWVREARLESRTIDGRRLFHRRAPQNLFLFSTTARGRRDAFRPPEPQAWSLVDHVRAACAEAQRTGATEVLPVHQRVTHTITVEPGHPAIRPGARVKAWLPFPQETALQRDVRLVEAGPGEARIAPPGRLDPAADGCLQRTVFLETVVADPPQPLVFREIFEFVSWAFCPDLEEALAAPLPAGWGTAYLGERPPHIVFTPEIRRQVEELVGDEPNPLVRARRIFRWVSRAIPWHAEDEYSTIPSLAVRGFKARRGDCGVQNTVFVTMCRIAGIPARWQSGFQTRPDVGIGMHDWAEIHVAPWGWIPADASYGIQAADDPRIADFFCGGRDSHRLIVNLDWGRELCPPVVALRSEPADFQRGEVEVDGRNLYFDGWSSRTTVERLPTP